MLVFVIPLKSARTSRSWGYTTQLVARTIRSACNQDCPDFRAILVCKDVPELPFKDPRVEILPVELPEPDSSLDGRRRDKGQKVLRGMLRAVEGKATHVMMLDADDCVSSRLAGHVTANPAVKGWFLRRGYFYQEGRKTIHLARWRFHQWCGSSHILRPELLDLPDHPTAGWTLPHRPTVRAMEDRGTPLRPLPFPGAVYNVAHGENLNDWGPFLWPGNPFLRLIRGILWYRPLTARLRAEFGLYPLDRDEPTPVV